MKESACLSDNKSTCSFVESIFCIDSDSLTTEMVNRISESVPHTIFATGLENSNTLKVFIFLYGE